MDCTENNNEDKSVGKKFAIERLIRLKSLLRHMQQSAPQSSRQEDFRAATDYLDEALSELAD